MTSVSKRAFGFTSASVYRRREPHAFAYLSERATFWIAVLSVFAFVTGNMIGQHGWAVFWKSVLGEGIESTIVFTGTVPPIPQIPDYQRWAKLGGSPRTNTFRQVPKDLLIPMPTYIAHGSDINADPQLRSYYFVEELGTYDTGRGNGSHAGVDISVPEGTPVVSVANGVVVKVADDPGGYGIYIMIKHPNVPNVEKQGEKSAIYSIYAHLSQALAQEGQVVQKGDQIALSGQTGNATAPHLHFQMEKSSAPFHPFWPFSGTEQRDANMTFTQAIDNGLHRERGLEYLLDPMLIVQAYETYQAPVTVEVAVHSASSPKPRALTIAERRQQRLARLAASSSSVVTVVCGDACKQTFIAYTESAPIIPIPQPASSSSSSLAPEAPVASVGEVKSIRISHDGSFGKARGWEKVTLMLLDDEGRVVAHPTSDDRVYLMTAYGRAEFKPSVVSMADFRNGVMNVEMLPLGESTVIIQAQPTGDVSSPMKYLR